MSIQYPTIADCIGNTPLVRLQRLPGQTSNTLLVKLEGNNPAGSVKDRPALSMITHAEQRGTIQPGDTLIEATSGNTGIALAMAAAIKGYRMLLIMPDNMSAERKAAMSAYGAELILVSKAEGMEGARDLALAMQAAGSSDPRVYKDKVMDVANAPGEPILPGQLDRALELLSQGQDIDYVGASAVELVGPGESAGSYREVEFKGGTLTPVRTR